MAYVLVMRRLSELGGIPKLREGSGKAGPVVTDNGNFLLDTSFGVIDDPLILQQQLIKIPGVVETGLFIKMANAVYVGKREGEMVECRKMD